MLQLPASITLVLAILTIFLCFVTGVKYAIFNHFIRTRLIMTAFFCFIVLTLSISFWHYAFATFPYTIPAAAVGAGFGYLIGVRTERRKLKQEGLGQYLDHFEHVHRSDLESLRWWSFVNFYSIMGGLVLINFVGLSTVIFEGRESWAIISSVVGAFLLGTIVPYILYLWSIRPLPVQALAHTENQTP